MAADPNGINYPQDKDLRQNLANEIRKMQSHPDRREAVQQAESWPEYARGIVERLDKGESQAMNLDEVIDAFLALRNNKSYPSFFEAQVFVKVNGGKKQPVTGVQLSGPVPQIKGAENLPVEIILTAGTDSGLR